ncbi:MAG TPA: LysR family transcriptional regulator substrate-binding protein [Beutenbergiaceae bacterium]|nr:LysR family transcriptional regulator substrate-binding protein [Beutenbergiaceae bacterium]
METRPSAAPFRLGIAEGVIPRKWVRRWGERVPQVPLDVVALPASGGEAQVRAGAVHAGLVRLPVAPGEVPVHAIPLYEEEPVVVVPTDHFLCAAERVQAEDFAEEVVLRPLDGVHWPIERGRPPLEQPRDAEGAVQLVAAGAGVLVVPKSIARLHHRKDLTYREVTDLPVTPVGLVWPVEGAHALIEELIGIVRGRTPRSTRGVAAEPPRRKNAAEKAAARREYLANKRGSQQRRPPRKRTR